MNKNILLAVTGMSPQVVTETIYALHKNKGITIDQVQIITTSIGKKQAWLGLGMEEKNQQSQLDQLCSDYNLPKINFTQDDILVIPNAQGEDVSDARSIEDHNALADFIINHVRALTEQEDITIYASLAGGRKTMTFFMGYAMSLFGRKQDSLSHVLVSEQFENVKDFFYPTPHNKRVVNYKNEAFNAKDAQVTLAEIPFVRMRDEMPERMIKSNVKYTETIALMNMAELEPELTINVVRKLLDDGTMEKIDRVIANGIPVKMANAEVAFLVWMAERVKDNLSGLAIPTDGAPDTEYPDDFLPIYELVNTFIPEQTSKTLSHSMDKAYFSDRKTKINSAFKNTLGRRCAKNFEIQALGKASESGPAKLFGLNIEAENITLYY
ncbi:MAG: TIGR02584 family CRISPR-associated protein [Pseudoalteromonas sp.]|nr:TIGR02584 family CRISPR-associated protein [Pseudoalteromonas sp.]